MTSPRPRDQRPHLSAGAGFYAPPFLDMHNRMKEVLALLGRLPPAVVRPPLVKLPAHEIERLRRAIAAAGLDRDSRAARRSPPNELAPVRPR